MRVAVAALLLLTACGPKTVPSIDGGTDVAGCSDDPRVASYSPGMSVMSTSGQLRFQLIQSEPAPPLRGNNSWTLKVTDTSGQAMGGLSLGVLAFMPDHGHGSSVVPEVSALSDGTYRITPLYLFMPGVWRITLTTSADGGSADSAAFYFCIEG